MTDRIFKPCPFCGSRTEVYEAFGRLVAGCENTNCKMKPSTWLTAGEIYDVRKLAKFWNSSISTPNPHSEKVE